MSETAFILVRTKEAEMTLQKAIDDAPDGTKVVTILTMSDSAILEISGTGQSYFDKLAGFRLVQNMRLEANPVTPSLSANLSTAFLIEIPWHLAYLARDKDNARPRAYVPSHRGGGVNIYILDSGIDKHADFGDRLVDAYTTPGMGSTALIDSGGHGTSVASVAAGKHNGVASKAMIHSVKMANGTFTSTIAIAQAFEWLAKHAQAPAVVNVSYSLDASFFYAIYNALEILEGMGIVVCKSGNNDKTCLRVRTRNVLVVGSIDEKGQQAAFSANTCAIYAPGKNVHTINNKIMDGTSFSSPMVAGILAQILSVDKDMDAAGQIRRLNKDATVVNGLLHARALVRKIDCPCQSLPGTLRTHWMWILIGAFGVLFVSMMILMVLIFVKRLPYKKDKSLLLH